MGILCLQVHETPGIGQDDTRFKAASQFQHRQRKVMVLSHGRFARAARFLQHIVQHVETASLSDLQRGDLNSARRAVRALKRERSHPPESLRPNASPATWDEVRRENPAPHSVQIVEDLLRRVEADYSKQVTLQGFARELGMNAAYLSALFSSSVGIPFKAYLTQVRLQKAKELLGSVANTASGVAFAVGYSSEEQFRRAFKTFTRLSPRQWRETMQLVRRVSGV